MDSSLILITPPTAAAVTLDEAKAQLRDPPDDDDFIQAIIDACVNQLDPAGGGWLGRALRPQTWELRLASFMGHSQHHHGNRQSGSEHHYIELPCPPLISMVSVTYTDLNGADQTLTLNTDYRVLGQGDPIRKQRIAPLYGCWWPMARHDAESVRIRFTSGYALTPADALPTPIKQAVLLGIKGLYDLGKKDSFLTTDTVIGVSSKSFAVTDAAVGVMRNAAESLLSTLQVWG